MDEITLVNLLNKICDKNGQFTWKLNCKYPEGASAIMQVHLLSTPHQVKTTDITFCMDTGEIIDGRHREMVRFVKDTNLFDALLDIMIYENEVINVSGN